MIKTQKARVVMLPRTDEHITHKDLLLSTTGTLTIQDFETGLYETKKPQELYITANLPLQVGDWFNIDILGYEHNIIQFAADQKQMPIFRKIVASTDSSLNVPKIPFNWIRDVYVPSNGNIAEIILKIQEWRIIGDHSIHEDYIKKEGWVLAKTTKTTMDEYNVYRYERLGLTSDNEIIIADTLKPNIRHENIIKEIVSSVDPNLLYRNRKEYFESLVEEGIKWGQQNNNCWVSVDHKKPYDNNLKIIWFAKATHFPDLSYGGINLAWWNGEHWANLNSNNIEDNPDYMVVTHWMEEPIAPTL